MRASTVQGFCLLKIKKLFDGFSLNLVFELIFQFFIFQFHVLFSSIFSYVW